MRRGIWLLALLAVACGSPGAPAPAKAPATAATAPAADDPGFDGPTPIARETFERQLAGKRLDDWYGMYAGEYKVGWMHLQLRPTEPGEPGGWTWRIEGAVVDNGMNAEPSESRFTEQAFYEAAAPHRLVEYRTSQDGRDGRSEMRFRTAGRALIVDETIDGAARPSRRLRASRETLASAMIQLQLDPAVVGGGAEAQIWGFDASDERDERSRVKVERIENRRLAGVPIKVATVRQETEGEAPMEVVVAAGGRVLTANVGQIVMRLEDRTLAKSDVVGFDLLRDAVPYEGPALGEPSSVKALRLRLTGLPADYPVPQGPNQKVSPVTGGIELALAAAPGAPVTAAERTAALATTPAIDWRDPAIVARAGKIVNGASSNEERIARLVVFVYVTLRKDLQTNISRASQVLQREVGDCTEHALLFTALARAAGIPARPVAGVTYMGDELRKFGWHEWAEVELGGRWVQVDPSWSETVANATHVKLEEDDSGRSVSLYGVIKLQRLD